MKTTIFIYSEYILVCKGLSNDGVAGARGAVFRKIRLGGGLYPGDFVKEMLGGYRRTTLSLLSSLQNFSMSHASKSLIPPSNTSRYVLNSSHRPTL